LSTWRKTSSLFSGEDGPGFIKPVAECAVLDVGTAFLRAAAHAEISIAKRQHRFELGQKIGSKSLFDDVPLIGRIITRWWAEPFVVEHRVVSPKAALGVDQSISSSRSRTTR